MSKVTYARHYHGDLVLIASVNTLLITDRATGLHDRRDPLCGSEVYTITEREESIARQCRTMQIKAKALSLVDCLPEGCDTRGLPYTGSEQTAILDNCKCIALAILHDNLCHLEVGDLIFGRRSSRHRSIDDRIFSMIRRLSEVSSCC